MLKHLTHFRKAEDGAVTVDWVVLTAAIVGFCIAAYTVIENSTLGLRDGLAGAISTENTF